MKQRLRRWSWVLATFVWTPAAMAQEAEGSVDDRATSFRAMEGPATESVAGGTLLVAAYAFVLVALLIYVARLGMLHARLQKDLGRVEQALSKAVDRPGR